MRIGLYFKIAKESIVKNKKIYLPYILTSTLMVCIFYILQFLSKSDAVSNMAGGHATQEILSLGSFVITIFALVFIFYTNAFLIRKRKKEFGLYNVLGMNKHNIGRIYFIETCMNFVLYVGLGIISGIALSKFSELVLVNLAKQKIEYSFSLSFRAIEITIMFFAIITALVYINGLRQIHLESPMELIKGETLGEKPPRANWLLGILGAVILIIAYIIALKIQQPLQALVWFFIAVLLVIVATYLLFISGSVLLCKILQKKKAYYYNKRHYVSVSQMIYRMKRNGAGLASICILLTMVLVMISSSACLFFGADDSLTARYPRDIDGYAIKYGYDENAKSNAEQTNNLINEKVEELEITKSNERNYFEYVIMGLRKEDKVDLSLNSESSLAFIKYGDVTEVHFLSIDDYNKIYGKNEKIRDDEAILFRVKTKPIKNTFKVGDREYKITKEIKKLDFEGAGDTALISAIFLIVNDIDDVAKTYKDYVNYDNSPMLYYRWIDQFDVNIEKQKCKEIATILQETLASELKMEGYISFYYSSYYSEHSDFYSTFSGLFFIGILLSIVFLAAVALIMYYKQMSEGYEDERRFEIMQKIGMTKQNIKTSIKSQMLMVFALPIVFAVMHLSFAFPVIYKLLMLFSLFNLKLLLTTTAISVIISILFYVIVYRKTSRTYYDIVVNH